MTPNGPGFSRVARDAMMAQLGGHERSGPRRLQPGVGRHLTLMRSSDAHAQDIGQRLDRRPANLATRLGERHFRSRSAKIFDAATLLASLNRDYLAHVLFLTGKKS
jgi:hypothetical protein